MQNVQEAQRVKTDLEKEIEIKENVRTTYAKVAVADNKGENCGISQSCCGTSPAKGADYSKQLGYADEELSNIPDGANMGLGCGNPTAIAGLKAGEVVLDLGSGGGFDCFLAARKVGETGRVIGVDMTSEMISKARLNAQKGGYRNVEFRLGEIEHLPVENEIVDVIISNCVVNLSTDKPQVFREAARVLKPGGRFIISDIVATSPLPESIKSNLTLQSGCMAGSMDIEELKRALKAAGLENVVIQVKESSREFIKEWAPGTGVEKYVASATIEAYRPTLELKKSAQVDNISASVPGAVGTGMFSASAKQTPLPPDSPSAFVAPVTGSACKPGSGCCPTK